MFKPVVLCVLLTVAALCAVAQQEPYKAADRHARRVPDTVPYNPQAYALYLTRPFADTVQKIRALYTWLAGNIRYDFDRYYSNNFRHNGDSSIADITFYNRRAVCAGYAALFARFCQVVGITCMNIAGYARGLSGRANQPVAEVNHEWNAVYLGGQWQLLDVTWARDTSFANSLDGYWFLPPPGQFALTHYPIQSQWQLLPEPMSRERFNRLPRFFARWFSMGFYDHSADEVTTDARGRFEIAVHNNSYYEMKASLTPADDSLAATAMPLEMAVTKKKTQYRIRGKIPKPGRWKLTVYAGGLAAPRWPMLYYNRYWGIVEFLVVHE